MAAVAEWYRYRTVACFVTGVSRCDVFLQQDNSSIIMGVLPGGGGGGDKVLPGGGDKAVGVITGNGVDRVDTEDSA
ncbi:hypothetical protein TNCV_1185291 [Trichonephila clavipes]|nr:hypothetical protein TNCV_1185291 [Trichonephila clavipes]